MSSTQLSLRQNTNESDDGIILRQRTGSTILDEASEAGIVVPITNNELLERAKEILDV